MISGKYHLKTHFFLFFLSVKISDYHPFLKNGCLIENKMHGASTQLGPVSHKCKLVGARVFPGRHVYGEHKLFSMGFVLFLVVYKGSYINDIMH